MALLKTVKTASLMPFCTGMQEGFFLQAYHRKYFFYTGNIAYFVCKHQAAVRQKPVYKTRKIDSKTGICYTFLIWKCRIPIEIQDFLEDNYI